MTRDKTPTRHVPASLRRAACLFCASALLVHGVAFAANMAPAAPSLRGSLSPAEGGDAPAMRDTLGAEATPPAVGTTGTVVGAPSGEADTAIALGSVLSDADAARYAAIFEHQDAGQWGAADALLAQVGDRVLVGHVLADRYISAGYRTSYNELKSWLAAYGDHPQAERLHDLAQKRRPKGAAAPPAPKKAHIKFPREAEIDAHRVPSRASTSERRRVAAVERSIRSQLKQERPTQALGYLQSPSVVQTLNPAEMDAMKGLIAASYFYENRPETAYDLAHGVAVRRRSQVPLADWIAGLSAWRLGKHEAAAHHFSALAKAPRISPWTRSAGAFWAARAELVAGAPERVSAHLRVAAQEETTFYGLLALKQLGQRPSLNWTLPDYSPADYQAALAIPAIRRGIALAETGEIARADEEIRRGHGRADPSLDGVLIALCEAHSLAASQLHIAENAKGLSSHVGLYPLPAYEPQGGFTVDPALIYAFMRQESRFKPQAKSHAGAQGLMQVMPGTAVHVTRDKSLKGKNRARLYDPGYNIKLGQRYIEQLMRNVEPRGNLFMLAVAYNGGPGNLRKWTRDMGGADDPLMFIESIPSRETRTYVERVVTNLWLYQLRLGEDTSSLTMVAEGDWPVYADYDPKQPDERPALTSMLMLKGTR